MGTDDVHGGDMPHDELSDEQLAALLDGGSTDAVGHPVADALLRARRELRAEPTPAPGAALSEFLGVGRVTDPIPPSAFADDVIDLVHESDSAPRRTPVFASLSTFLGTLTGKLLVGTTVAAASVTGAHAAGVVDVPGLPAVDDPAVTETIDDPDDDTDPLGDTADGDDLADDDRTVDDSPDDDDDSDDDNSGDDDSDDDADDTDSDDDADESDDDDSDDDSDGDDTDDADDSDDSDDDADDDSDDSDDDDADDDPVTTSTTTTAAPAGPITKAYTVPGVGTTTVSVAGGQISLVSAVPTGAWILDEAGPDEDGVESKYVNGDLETRIDFEIEDGQLRVRIREENDATDERTERFEFFPL